MSVRTVRYVPADRLTAAEQALQAEREARERAEKRLASRTKELELIHEAQQQTLRENARERIAALEAERSQLLTEMQDLMADYDHGRDGGAAIISYLRDLLESAGRNGKGAK